jgi:HD-like signal output (HDOD) protein
MTRDAILEKVKSFPPLDDTVSKVMAICNDENGSVSDLAKAVESDPMTMANILKAANSPLYGFSREIKGINQAVSIFGMDTVKGFAFSSFLQKKLDLNIKPYGLDDKGFIELTETQNALTVNWMKSDRSKLDILSLTSFLMDMGKIIISNLLEEEGVAQAFKEEADKTTTLLELEALEKEYCGISNEEITAIVFEEWNFDENMCNSIKYLNHPENAEENIKIYSQILQIVKTATTTQNISTEDKIKNAIELATKYSLDTNTLQEAIKLQFVEAGA